MKALILNGKPERVRAFVFAQFHSPHLRRTSRLNSRSVRHRARKLTRLPSLLLDRLRRARRVEVERVHRPALVINVEVAVAVEGDVDAAVAQELRDDRDGLAALQEQGCRGVAGVVEADLLGDRLDPHPPVALLAAAGLLVLRLDAVAALRCAAQVQVAGDDARPTQGGAHHAQQVELAVAVAAAGAVRKQPVSLRSRQRREQERAEPLGDGDHIGVTAFGGVVVVAPAHREGAGLQVHVIALEAQDLALAQARVEGDREERAQFLAHLAHHRLSLLVPEVGRDSLGHLEARDRLHRVRG